MSISIEKLFINSNLKKVIRCYCKECVEEMYGKVSIATAPKIITLEEPRTVTCPCDDCLHEYKKNNIRMITFENSTICHQTTKCHECLEYQILCLNFKLNELKNGNKPNINAACSKLDAFTKKTAQKIVVLAILMALMIKLI